jgi:hypothetical protein
MSSTEIAPIAIAFADLIDRIKAVCPEAALLGEGPSIGIANPKSILPPGTLILDDLMFKAECSEIFSRFDIPHYKEADGVLIMRPKPIPRPQEDNGN